MLFVYQYEQGDYDDYDHDIVGIFEVPDDFNPNKDKKEFLKTVTGFKKKKNGSFYESDLNKIDRAYLKYLRDTFKSADYCTNI